MESEPVAGCRGQPPPENWRQNRFVHISARADYAVRALLALASAEPTQLTMHELADEQELPPKFLEAILADLRKAGIVRSRRGAEGGYTLGRSADEISVGDVIRAVDGPLAAVRGIRPEQTEYEGAAEHLQEVWVAVRAAVRSVLDEVTLADVLAGSLPEHVQRLVTAPEAWRPR